MTSFIRLFASKTLKTFILDRFLSENTITPLVFQQFYFVGCENTIKHMFFHFLGWARSQASQDKQAKQSKPKPSPLLVRVTLEIIFVFQEIQENP